VPPVDSGPRFDARDAVIEPRDVLGPRDVPADLPTFVDVAVPTDTGAPAVDAGGRVDAAAFDAPVAQDGGACATLAESYANAVRSAQQCTEGAACSTLACETLCCACEVYVNPAVEAFALLDRLRRMAQTLGCTELLPCPGKPCAMASRAVCSGEGRCVTLRSSEGDGGP